MKRYECFGYYQNALRNRIVLSSTSFEHAFTNFWNNTFMRENQCASSIVRLLTESPDMMNTYRFDDQGFTVIIKCIDTYAPSKPPIKPSAPFVIDFADDIEPQDPTDAWINQFLAA